MTAVMKSLVAGAHPELFVWGGSADRRSVFVVVFGFEWRFINIVLRLIVT